MSAAYDLFIEALKASGSKGRGSKWTCPAHEDRNPSLSVHEGDGGKVLVHCHAGCTLDDILAAVGLTRRGLFPDGDERKDRRNDATYDYCDEKGNLLFQVVRFDPKDFRQRRPDGNGGWIWNLDGVRRVPYRLGDVIRGVEAGRPIYVVEGEKDADALAALGLVATTNPGGAGKWLPEFNVHLRGADVIVIADRDDVGRNHARGVARSLEGAAASVEVYEPPAPHKDVSDLLGAGGSLEELVPLGDDGSAEEARSVGEGSGQQRRSQADLLVELARARYRFGRAFDDEPFAVPLDGPRIARPLRGGRASLRAEIAAAFVDEHGKAPSSTALADAMNVLEGLAIRSQRERLELRVAQSGAARYLDLGDESGRVVEIAPDRWRLVEASPVLFRRTEPMLPLPQPERGGNLEALHEVLNVADDDWPLVLAWAVAALKPDIPHPILLLQGGQGSAKSTGARVLATLLDPSAAPLRSAPRDATEWAVAAAASWVVAVDNISAIRPWFSDALCRAVTGDGLVRRALYTDSAVSVLAFRRCVILTSIDPGALRGDLAQRILAVELEEIGDERRREDAELAAAFEAVRAPALGALLDLAVEVERAKVHLTRKPRMADFARILAGVDAVLGTYGLDRYLERAHELQHEVLDADPFGLAVRELVAASGGWEGEANELLKRLARERPPQGWPSTPRGVRAALERLRVPLRAAGVEVRVERRRHGGRRTIQLKMVGNQPSPSSPPQQNPRSEASLAGDGSTCEPSPDRHRPSPTVTATVTTETAGQGQHESHGDGGDGSTPSIFSLGAPSPGPSEPDPSAPDSEPVGAPGSGAPASPVDEEEGRAIDLIMEAFPGAEVVGTYPTDPGELIDSLAARFSAAPLEVPAVKLAVAAYRNVTENLLIITAALNKAKRYPPGRTVWTASALKACLIAEGVIPK